MFGSNNTGSLFGNNTSASVGTPSAGSNTFQLPQQQRPTSLFGNTGSNTMTNNTGATPGGLFGSGNTAGTPSASTGGLFGAKPATGGLFGNSNAAPNTYSSTGTTTTGGLFGNSTLSNSPSISSTSGGLFANANTPATTAPSTTGTGLFGAAKPASTLGTGLFATNKPATAQSTGALFADSTPSNTGGLFGNSNPTPSGGLFANNTSGISNMNTQQQANPYGFNVPPTMTTNTITKMPDSITSSLRKNPVSVNNTNNDNNLMNSNNYGKTQSSKFSSTCQGTQTLVDKLTSGTKDGSIMNSPHGRNVTSTPYNKYGFLSNYKSNSRNNTQHLFYSKSPPNHNILSSRVIDPSGLRKLNIEPQRIAAKKSRLLSGMPHITKSIADTHRVSVAEEADEIIVDNSNDKPNNIFSKSTVKNLDDDPKEVKVNTKNETDYWCSPSIEELQNLPEYILKSLPDFVIGRKSHGYITFNFPVDLSAFKNDFSGSLFGGVVKFNSTKTVEVYPDSSSKPERGLGMNVPATITLENIFPIDQVTKLPIKDSARTPEFQKFVAKLRRMKGMEFVSYNPYSGSWTFNVQHFSIWGLVEDAEEETHEEENNEQIPCDKLAGQPLHVDEYSQPNDAVTFQKDIPMTYEEDMQDLDEFIINERQYEPEVTAQDFMGLEANPKLEVSTSWSQQLNIAGKSLFSIFSNSHDKAGDKAVGVKQLFSDFEKTIETSKAISSELKYNPYSFGKLSTNSLLLLDQKSKIIQTSEMPYKIKNGSLTSNIFEKLLNTVVVLNRDSNAYPIISMSSLKFSDLSTIYRSENVDSLVWDFCSILFDPIELTYDVDNDDAKLKLCKKTRFNNLCSWISSQIKDELSGKLIQTENELSRIFLYLAMNDVMNATKLAINSKNAHLAVLVTYFGSNNPQVRKYAKLQLEKWESMGNNVDVNITRIYRLLSNTLFEDERLMDEIKGEFSFLAQLGLLLYYGQIDEYSLEELVSSILSKTGSTNDIINDILKVFSSQQNVVEILKESSLSSEFSNIENLWYFVEILTQSESFTVNEELSEKVTLDMIETMRCSNMVVESLIVSSFIINDNVAKQQFDSIIYHETPQIMENHRFNFIFDRLKLPVELKFNALALYNKYSTDHILEFENLIKAKNFKQAETLFATVVAPRLIRGDAEDRKRLSLLISTVDRFQIETWNKNFGIYEQYLSVVADESQQKKQDIVTLANSLSVYAETHRDCTEVKVSCNFMAQNLFSLISKQSIIDPDVKSRLQELPLGEPEKAYLAATLN
ncbi:hypothetical protein TPHA_0N01210 [Tetrapisispora phaffii CBS 4417]|uniref:Peptidase S59 domain-containing protein n=1 Tax=Tetrapisispora phaffii (strain ATCC 24235 / CBS 4417 / NBRC 1672 / NRRL Y-8282 / UCD 70-5) TaxID=1071381 RepID=G8C174_TETPH|nr:hypothetical protein TPHA_0N01210 [Tetrapisispora phaffii CBS 4417]CCE65902.1 hypothetical protein TPHA_0N01210 [Tetrapisispora phaffii CBS 4417]